MASRETPVSRMSYFRDVVCVYLRVVCILVRLGSSRSLLVCVRVLLQVCGRLLQRRTTAFLVSLPRLVGGTACATGPPRYSTTTAAAARACVPDYMLLL
jgi:hypothetical protein